MRLQGEVRRIGSRERIGGGLQTLKYLLVKRRRGPIYWWISTWPASAARKLSANGCKTSKNNNNTVLETSKHLTLG